MISLKLAKQLKDAGLLWIPENGDFFATGDDDMANIFVISSNHELVKEMGGTVWFFGAGFCSRDGGCVMRHTFSDCINMDGMELEGFKDYQPSSVKELLFVPRLDQLIAEIRKRGYKWFPDMESLEESAGKTLLWIIQKEREDSQ